MQGIGVGMRGIRVGMRGIKVRIFVFITSAKLPEPEGSISPSSFYGQLPDY